MKTLLRLADSESGPPVTRERTKDPAATSTSALFLLHALLTIADSESGPSVSQGKTQNPVCY